MSETLYVKIVDLIARMVHMKFGALEEEETVVVNLLLASIEMQKRGVVVACCRVKYYI
jgi:hypothetical protein